MAYKDTAKDVKNALAAAWDPETAPAETAHAGWVATLHVDDDWRPSDDKPELLVADDGGPTLLRGRWAWSHGLPQPDHTLPGERFIDRQRPGPRRPLLRLTAFAKGRDMARNVVMTAADYVVDHHVAMGIARIDDVSDPLITRDRATGAYLASVTMPAIVRSSTG
jgi:hypothetical protein